MARMNGLVLRLFREQSGLVSRAQAMNAGLSEKSINKRLQRGDWDIVANGVYRLPGTRRLVYEEPGDGEPSRR